MEFQIAKQTLIYLFISLTVIIMPHLERSPLVLPTVFIVAVFWQFKIYRQQWPFPRAIYKTAIVLLVLGLIWLQHKSFLSLEAITQLLLLTVVLKLLELKAQRDVLTVLYLSYFTMPTGQLSIIL